MLMMMKSLEIHQISYRHDGIGSVLQCEGGQVAFDNFFDSGQVVFGDAITEEEVAEAI